MAKGKFDLIIHTRFHDTAKRLKNVPSQVYGRHDIDYQIHHQLQPDDSHHDNIAYHLLAPHLNRINCSFPTPALYH